LRGLACVIVFNFHFLYPYSDSMKHGFGANAENRYLLQLPIVCLLVRGRAMVTLFFAISGYVLSYNFFSSCRDKQWDKAFSRLASLTLRRWMRLFLPASLSMLVVCFGVQMGAFRAAKALQHNPLAAGKWEEHPPHFPDFQTQMWDFAGMWWRWSSPFRWDLNYSPYDPHTWTIPVELRCSFVLFVLLVGSAGLKQRWRMGLTVLVAIYCLLQTRWDVATFIGGALVADVHQATAAHSHERHMSTLPLNNNNRPSPEHDEEKDHPPRPTTTKTKTTLKWLLLLTSLYLLSFPDNLSKTTPGYRTLRHLAPHAYHNPHYFYHALASPFVLYTIPTLPPIRTFLSSPLPQYFGRISFALYLVHGPLLHSLGFNLQPWIFGLTGHEGVLQWGVGLLAGWVVMFGVAVVVAHGFGGGWMGLWLGLRGGWRGWRGRGGAFVRSGRGTGAGAAAGANGGGEGEGEGEKRVGV
jgi:peptidoglycan/LPS O-acetylase OafA/YrhL